MTTTERIDVTVLEPRMKHPTIFKMFDTLNEGESFLIYNDHDPKPLYYQLLGERGNIFTWEYIENGPLNWQVKIRKNISYKEPTIGEIVAGDHRTAEVFKKFNIDFCCGGKKTLSEACSEKHINKSDVEVELNNLTEQTKTASQDYTNWPLDFLVDYIVNTHHNYVKNAIPILLSYTEKVAKVHGKTNEEVITVHQHLKKQLKN